VRLWGSRAIPYQLEGANSDLPIDLSAPTSHSTDTALHFEKDISPLLTFSTSYSRPTFLTAQTPRDSNCRPIPRLATHRAPRFHQSSFSSIHFVLAPRKFGTSPDVPHTRLPATQSVASPSDYPTLDSPPRGTQTHPHPHFHNLSSLFITLDDYNHPAPTEHTHHFHTSPLGHTFGTPSTKGSQGTSSPHPTHSDYLRHPIPSFTPQ
jgi:hypothetical protein